MTREEIQLIISGHNNGAVTALRGTLRATNVMADGTIGHFKRVASAVFNLQNAIAAGAAAMAIKAVISPAVDIESAQIQFEVLLKDAGAARLLLDDILDFSASTPLEFGNLNDGAKQLLAVGVAGSQIIPTMQILGDLSGGNAAKLETVTRAYVKMKAKGKATLEELNMLTEAGIPILDAVAKQQNMTTAEVFKYISAGKLGFRDVALAMQSMTVEGGQFEGMMAKMAQSTEGKVSTLRDNWKLLRADFGKAVKPVLNEAIEDLLNVMQELKDSGAVADFAKDARTAFENLYNAVKNIVGFIQDNQEMLKTLGLSYIGVQTITAASDAFNVFRASLVAAAQGATAVASAETAVAGAATTATVAVGGLQLALASLGTVAVAAGIAAIIYQVTQLNKATFQLQDTINTSGQSANAAISFRRDAAKTGYVNRTGSEDGFAEWYAADMQRRVIADEKARFNLRKGIKTKTDKAAFDPGADTPDTDAADAARKDAEKAAVKRAEERAELLKQESSLLNDMAAAEAKRIMQSGRDSEIADIDAAISAKRAEHAVTREAIQDAEDQAAAAKKLAAAKWAAVVNNQPAPADAKPDRDAQRDARAQARAEARAEGDLIAARRLQGRGFRLNGRQRDLINADNARRDAAAMADVLTGEKIKAQMAQEDADQLQRDKDAALAKFAEQDYMAGVDKQTAKLEEIRTAIAALDAGGAPGANPPPVLDPYPIANAIAAAIPAALPQPPAAADYASIDRHLAAIAVNTGTTAKNIMNALGMTA